MLIKLSLDYLFPYFNKYFDYIITPSSQTYMMQIKLSLGSLFTTSTLMQTKLSHGYLLSYLHELC
jgi:hypothetical protein